MVRTSMTETNGTAGTRASIQLTPEFAPQFAPEFTPEFTPELLCKKL